MLQSVRLHTIPVVTVLSLVWFTAAVWLVTHR